MAADRCVRAPTHDCRPPPAQTLKSGVWGQLQRLQRLPLQAPAAVAVAAALQAEPAEAGQTAAAAEWGAALHVKERRGRWRRV